MLVVAAKSVAKKWVKNQKSGIRVLNFRSPTYAIMGTIISIFDFFRKMTTYVETSKWSAMWTWDLMNGGNNKVGPPKYIKGDQYELKWKEVWHISGIQSA